MQYRLVSQHALGKEGLRLILDDGTGEIVHKETGQLAVKTALISHPSLQELVLHRDDATEGCAIADSSARPLEPIDPEEDVTMQENVATNQGDPSNTTSAKLPVNMPIPLLLQELWHC